jgi:hypothetical protein
VIKIGRALGISALILGLVGAGLGGYVFVTNTIFPMVGITESPSVQNTWFIQTEAGRELGNGVYAYLYPNSHLITVNQGESVYILFTGYHKFTTGGTNAYYLILLDGVTQTYTLLTRTSTGTERMTISMQYGISGLSTGTYNISISGYSNIANQECFRSALLVQTYI